MKELPLGTSLAMGISPATAASHVLTRRSPARADGPFRHGSTRVMTKLGFSQHEDADCRCSFYSEPSGTSLCAPSLG